jgi:hypothetical protein
MSFTELDPKLIPKDINGRLIEPGYKVVNRRSSYCSGYIGGYLLKRGRSRETYGWWYVSLDDVEAGVQHRFPGWDDYSELFYLDTSVQIVVPVLSSAEVARVEDLNEGFNIYVGPQVWLPKPVPPPIRRPRATLNELVD